MRLSQISLRVGNDGVACHSRPIGTSPTTAIVAAWMKSATSAPVIVAPTMTSRSLSTSSRDVPDGGDLRVGEDDARRLAAVGALLGRRGIAEDVLAREPRLVLAHVGVERAAVDVADRVEPVVAGHLHVLVDLDVLTRLEADRVEAELAGVRAAAERGDELAALDGGAVVELDADGVARVRDLRRLAARADVDPQRGERVADLLAGEHLLRRQHVALALDERDLGAERLVGLRELRTDHPAAEDEDAVGHLLGRGGLAVRPRLGLLEPLDRGQ